MDTLFLTSSPTLNPTPYFSTFTHPDTQNGTIIVFTYLGSTILILMLITYFCCGKKTVEKPIKKQNNNKDNTSSTNLPYVPSEI
jgi:hypothetical protein